MRAPVIRAGALAAVCLTATGCMAGPRGGGTTALPTTATGTPLAPTAVVSESWVSEADPQWDVDTPALWSDGSRSVVLTTAKATHELRLFDGADGSTLGALGMSGGGVGEFRRPNGVVVVGDYAMVVERDNRRVQVLHMPEGRSLGFFGNDVLVYPYGLATAGDPSSLTVWVTDDYEYEEDVVPLDLTRRVHRFELVLSEDAAPRVRNHATFGAPNGGGSLRVVESIQADPDRNLLYIADESRKRYLEYDMTGRYRDRELGAGWIAGDPEGIMLVRCGAEHGYWLVTDQQEDVSWFRVFDRRSLDYRGSFRGQVTANTDGATFERGPVPGFPNGAIYAVHDDQAVAAFDWGAVVEALGLRTDCSGR